MKFLKLGLILSVVALNSTSAFAQRPSASIEEAFYKTQGPSAGRHYYDSSEEYETLKNEAMTAFNIQNDVNIRNGIVNDGLGEIFNKFMPAEYRQIIIDEHKLNNAPIGAKRWIVYYLMAQLNTYNDPNNDLHKSIMEAWNSNNSATLVELQKELENKAEATACDILKCEQCCTEFADFIEQKSLHSSSTQQIREHAKQHVGKSCKYHQSVQTVEEKKEEATNKTSELPNPFVDGSVIPTPAFDAEEEVVKLFKAAAGLSVLEASVKQDPRLAEFNAVIAAIKEKTRNAFNYETQYKKLTAAIRHRFGANLFEIVKFVKG